MSHSRAAADARALLTVGEHRAEVFEFGSVELIVFEAPAACTLPSQLSKSEATVVQLLLEGMNTTEIAEARAVTYRTIAKQLGSVYRKLGVTSAQELLIALLAMGSEANEQPVP